MLLTTTALIFLWPALAGLIYIITKNQAEVPVFNNVEKSSRNSNQVMKVDSDFEGFVNITTPMILDKEHSWSLNKNFTSYHIKSYIVNFTTNCFYINKDYACFTIHEESYWWGPKIKVSTQFKPRANKHYCDSLVGKIPKFSLFYSSEETKQLHHNWPSLILSNITPALATHYPIDDYSFAIKASKSFNRKKYMHYYVKPLYWYVYGNYTATFPHPYSKMMEFYMALSLPSRKYDCIITKA